jgi:hypothetical protein
MQSGVHGRVVSSVTGQPLAATISVNDIDHPVSFYISLSVLRILDVALHLE